MLIKLGGRTNAVFRIQPVASPTAQQKQIYRSWLSTPATKG
jgi:hypothetical protein